MDDESHTGRRLTVQQAADALDVTVDAIRGRLRRGTIRSVREGGRVYVILTGDESHTVRDQQTGQYIPPEEEDSSTEEPTSTVEVQKQLVEELQDRVRSLERSLDREREARREESRELRRLLAASLERIPAIEPPETTESPEAAPGDTESTETPADATGAQEAPQQERRSWWRRLFWGES